MSENPQVAEELKALLERYRLAGYSRELPSDSEVKELIAAAEAKSKPKAIPELRSPIEAAPPAPWAVLRGDWQPKDGALTITAEQGQPAALTVPFTQAPLNATYSVRLGKVERQTVRLDVGDGQSFRFDVSPGELAIVQNAANGQGQVVLAERVVSLPTEQWYDVSIKIEGNKANPQGRRRSHRRRERIDRPQQSAFTFVVIDGSVALRM